MRTAKGSLVGSRLFLDTEWLDERGPKLVSLALVAETGEEFYAECAAPPKRPTRFVERVVYPLLEGGATALDDFAFAIGLRAFIGRYDTPTIIYGFLDDLTLLVTALNGFERFKGSALDAAAPMPSYATLHIGSPELRAAPKLILVDPCLAWFEVNPTAMRRHALHDARALRHVCLSLHMPDQKRAAPRLEESAG